MVEPIDFYQPRHKVELFHDAKGEQKKAVVFNVNDIAQFPDACPEMSKTYFEQESTWKGLTPAEAKKTVKGKTINSQESARSIVKAFEFPEAIRRDADKVSRYMNDVMIEQGRPRVLRNQAQGRFDVRTMPRVITDMHKGTYDRYVTRPYYTRERLAPTTPHVAVIASAGWGEMWNNPQYIPTVAQLCLGIAWACEAVDCFVTAALCRNTSIDSGVTDVGALVLHDDLTRTPLNNYGIFFHPDLYRNAIHTMWASNARTLELKRGKPTTAGTRGHSTVEVADGKALGVSWAKEARGATITVAIGDLADKSRADLCLTPQSDLETSVKALATVLSQQMRRN